MSTSKSKLDLLVRVRYLNPIPPPPCPPKLVDIPTDPQRYAKPEFLNAIAQETPFPMVVDAELGMPLDLGTWDSLWELNGNDSALNPDPNDLPILDPKDEFLLLDPSSSSSANFLNGSQSHASTSAALPAHVSWLRKTEYLSRESSLRSPDSSSVASRANRTSVIDVSRAAQLANIEASFAAAQQYSEDSSEGLEGLRHPTKPGLKAVASHPFLPDADIWANAYDLFRFAERPGERAVDVDDPRLDCAVMRPMESDGDHFLAYYLTQDDETALAFKESRVKPQSKDDDPPNTTSFHFVRDFETVKIEQDITNEFLLVLDDGVEVDPAEDSAVRPARPKGAYFKNIERKMFLKKKRVNPLDTYQDKWDTVHVSLVPFEADELQEREEVKAVVDKPEWIREALAADPDADGEPDAEGEDDPPFLAANLGGMTAEDATGEVDVDM